MVGLQGPGDVAELLGQLVDVGGAKVLRRRLPLRAGVASLGHFASWWTCRDRGVLRSLSEIYVQLPLDDSTWLGWCHFQVSCSAGLGYAPVTAACEAPHESLQARRVNDQTAGPLDPAQ